jgi:hypothetical protein
VNRFVIYFESEVEETWLNVELRKDKGKGLLLGFDFKNYEDNDTFYWNKEQRRPCLGIQF